MEVLVRAKYFSGLVLWVAGGLFACGGGGAKPADAGGGGEEGGHEHEHEPDPADDVVPCPQRIPDFEIGMTVSGTKERIRARLVGASPVSPRKYENSWTFEFLDANDQPITDIEVTPDEPWMDVHNHGGGYPPDVMPVDEPARLEFDRVNLRMSGPWRLNLNASSKAAGIDDVIVVEACVP